MFSVACDGYSYHGVVIEITSSSQMSSLGSPAEEGRASTPLCRLGDATQNKENKSPYYQRLYDFYLKYNASKIQSVDDYLKIYEGREEELFALLDAKYNVNEKTTSCSQRAENASPGAERHYSGKRFEIPKKVSPQDGNTDCETPYWAGGSLVSDKDLLQLLCTRQTENPELQKCFMGTFPQHPDSSWNGMTYICFSGRIAAPETLFLGHVWSGTLNSEKTMFYEKQKCRRISLYCTEKCQRENRHERWRLSVYLTGMREPSYLIRTVWDPVIVPEPLPPSQSYPSGRDYYSSEAIPTRLSSQSSDGIIQPARPQLQTDVSSLVKKLIDDLEQKLKYTIIPTHSVDMAFKSLDMSFLDTMLVNRKVHIILKMVGIPLFDDEADFVLSEQLISVKHKVEVKHGGTCRELRFWKDEVEPSSILRDFNVPLIDLVRSSGIELGEETPTLTLYYDFSPPEGLCPILNAKVSPNTAL
eukprot:gene13362-9191_t